MKTTYFLLIFFLLNLFIINNVALAQNISIQEPNDKQELRFKFEGELLKKVKEWTEDFSEEYLIYKEEFGEYSTTLSLIDRHLIITNSDHKITIDEDDLTLLLDKNRKIKYDYDEKMLRYIFRF
ncbi:hypothetical protein [Orenia marismortui]|uniref:Uncharacterized protein n=1 Tax=Orenia marismortui TaxID=46469 RepID=A0A4R8HG02_9FIRM|nr:hypothetical protein [Orenia marismortui]TDX59156.1 hypothetical protein C7959_10142 [Orenia marismortui]